jgi:2-aminoadipate transaminase
VAFVPGRAAYLDGRGGSAMRLNFSGVGEEGIREGIRRIGEVVREQVAMYGTLTGAGPRVEGTLDSERRVPRVSEGDVKPASQRETELAEVLRLPAQRQRAG